MSNRNNAYTEVYAILQYLNEEEYNKISHEIVDAIRLNINVEYEYTLNNELDLEKQPMLPETKAILFNLFRDYLATPEQKNKIIQMQNEERQKNELRKQQLYSSNVFENRQKENVYNQNIETKQIVKYKENIFKRILDKLKKFFGKK